MEVQAEVASNQYEFVAATGSKPDRHIIVRIKQRHLKLATLAVAAITGVTMSMEMQGVFAMHEPAWICLQAVFGLSFFSLLQKR